MKKLFTNLKVFMTLLLLCGVCSAWADTASWTAASNCFGSTISSVNGTASGTFKTGDYEWNYTRTLKNLGSGKSDYIAMNGGYIQIGSSNAGEDVVLSTSNIPGNITSIVMDCGSANHSVLVTIGGETCTISPAISSTKQEITATPGTKKSGDIQISFSIGSNKAALYLKTIEVTYEVLGAKYAVTYDGNGATSGTVPTDANEYEKNASITVLGNTGNLALAGYNFGGWNTKADATGTDYAAGSTFNIQQNTTLYAKWNAISYTITKTSVEGGSCSVKVDGTEVSTAATGTKLTLSNTPAEGYKFEKYVIDYTKENGTPGQSNITTGHYTMPASNITITPKFAEKQQYSVAFYDKGELYATANVYEGETLAEALSDVQEPVNDNSFEGYSFQGWSTNQDVDNLNIINDEYIINANTELFAVFGKAGKSASYRKVTSAPTDWSGNYLIVYADSKAFNGVDETSDYVEVSPENGVIATLPAGGVTVTIAPMDGGYSLKVNGGTNKGKYMCGTSGSNKLNFESSAQLNTIDMDANNVTITSNTSKFLFNNVTTGNRFRYYKSTTTIGTEYVLPQLYKEEGGTAAEYSLEGPQIHNVTITAVGYATAYVPFAARVTDGTTAYYVTVDGSSAKLHEIDGTIPANTGVVLKGAAGTATFTESAVDPTTDFAENVLEGVLTDTPAGDLEVTSGNSAYVLNSVGGQVGFYPLNETGTLAANRAYMEVPDGAAVKAFFFDEEATSIHNSQFIIHNSENVMYNLNGQVVGKDYKGIVIVNGKKMLNK